MAKSKIEWTDRVWNPVTGCSKISPGCANCYAERMALRLQTMGQERYRNGFEVTCHPGVLDEPLRWTKPSKIFVCSMSDLFHDDVPIGFITNVLLTIQMAQQHTFMILTKRAERAKKLLSAIFTINLPLPNLWIGVTAENQEQADKRIPVLLQIPAAKRFVSVEPMVGPVDLERVGGDRFGWGRVDALNGIQYVRANAIEIGCEWDTKDIPSLDWVICGGESGPGARPMHPSWARSLRDQCQAAGVPFLFKQWGEWWPINGTGIYNPDINDKQFLKTPPYCWLTGDGKIHQSGAKPDALLLKVGKKKAGRLLDGQLWDQYPSI